MRSERTPSDGDMAATGVTAYTVSLHDGGRANGVANILATLLTLLEQNFERFPSRIDVARGMRWQVMSAASGVKRTLLARTFPSSAEDLLAESGAALRLDGVDRRSRPVVGAWSVIDVTTDRSWPQRM